MDGDQQEMHVNHGLPISKATIASQKAREVSDSRRIHEAKFTCSFEGCNNSFTRKHNLDCEYFIYFRYASTLLILYLFYVVHLKAHRRVADFQCNICNKAFTTPHVLKRHLDTCQKKQYIGRESIEDPQAVEGTL